MNTMKITLYSVLSLVVLGLLLPEVSTAASCTSGVNCYCDKVKGGSLNDPLLLFCEDFEAPSLYQAVPVGASAPNYGSWYDATGLSGDRGHNSYWQQKYGNGVSSFLFTQGQPASPALGSPCNFSLCTGMKVWDRTNRWSANAYNPLAAFFTQASDFNAEVGSLTAPTNAAGGGSGVFDGNANLVYRIAPGTTHGIAGKASFPATTEVGLTMALAYPRNSLASGVWGTDASPAAWKHDEWATVNSPNCGFDGLFAFYNQTGPRSGRPFAGFIGAFGSGCTGGGYNGSITNISAGRAELINGGIGVYWNTPTNYNQPTDWPEGTWGCVRGHLVISGGSEHYRVWFQGPNMTSERLLIDVTFTSSGLDNTGGYDGFKWNAYANTNQGGGYVASTALTFRYEDNVHARKGLPVPCSQIGFVGGSGGGDIIPPSPPTNLQIN